MRFTATMRPLFAVIMVLAFVGCKSRQTDFVNRDRVGQRFERTAIGIRELERKIGGNTRISDPKTVPLRGAWDDLADHWNNLATVCIDNNAVGELHTKAAREAVKTRLDECVKKFTISREKYESFLQDTQRTTDGQPYALMGMMRGGNARQVVVDTILDLGRAVDDEDRDRMTKYFEDCKVSKFDSIDRL